MNNVNWDALSFALDLTIGILIPIGGWVLGRIVKILIQKIRYASKQGE